MPGNLLMQTACAQHAWVPCKLTLLELMAFFWYTLYSSTEIFVIKEPVGAQSAGGWTRCPLSGELGEPNFSGQCYDADYEFGGWLYWGWGRFSLNRHKTPKDALSISPEQLLVWTLFTRSKWKGQFLIQVLFCTFGFSPRRSYEIAPVSYFVS